jgi:DNA-binding NarL/FixJ family response regulator
MLIFSMHPEEQYAVRAIRAGALGYLSKESSSELLLPAIRKVVSGSAFISAKVAQLLASDVSRRDVDLPHTKLSDREYEVFARIVHGARMSDIAAELNLSIKTVSTHKSNILAKMEMKTTMDLLRYALDHSLMDSSAA